MNQERQGMDREEAGRMGGEAGGHKGGETSMHSEKVSASQLAMYLKGVSFPVDKQELINKVRSNGAPETVINMLNRLPGRQYTRPTEIEEEFSKFK